MSDQFEALTAGQQFAPGAAGLAPAPHLLLGSVGRIGAASLAITTQLPADGRGGSVDQAGNPSLTEALDMTDLDRGALCNAEFGIGHRGSTVPEWSGVALSFRGRPFSADFQQFKACSCREIHIYLQVGSRACYCSCALGGGRLGSILLPNGRAVAP